MEHEISFWKERRVRFGRGWGGMLIQRFVRNVRQRWPRYTMKQRWVRKVATGVS